MLIVSQVSPGPFLSEEYVELKRACYAFDYDQVSLIGQ